MDKLQRNLEEVKQKELGIRTKSSDLYRKNYDKVFGKKKTSLLEEYSLHVFTKKGK